VHDAALDDDEFGDLHKIDPRRRGKPLGSISAGRFGGAKLGCVQL
jgi:hypothetical protein